MAIPASQIVNITPRVISAGSTELSLTGLFLTENSLAPFPQSLTFPTLDSVGQYFGIASQEYNIARKYFLGYDNSFRKPNKVTFSRRVNKDLAAFVIGAQVTATVANFKNITAGSLRVTIDNTQHDIYELDFSAVTTYSDVAMVVQTALREVSPGATVVYSTVNRGFILTSGSEGDDSSVSTVESIFDESTLVTLTVEDDPRVEIAAAATQGQDVAMLLKMNAESGATVSSGSDELNQTENMESIVANYANWASFSTIYQADDEEHLGLAEWANGRVDGFLYVGWTRAENLTSQTAVNTLADQITENNYGATTFIFGDADYAAMIMGTGASVDWNRAGGAINFAFKSQEGLAATVTDAITARTLLDRRVNFYGRYATRSDEFIHLYDGSMFGSYRFIDPFWNSIWLRNVLQTSLYDGLIRSPRTPYTDEGYTKIRAWMIDVINRALNNGVIEAGVNLSESQKVELYQESGDNTIAEKLFANGYFIQILDATAAIRVNRDSPVINLWYTYGGSINRLEVAATAIL